MLLFGEPTIAEVIAIVVAALVGMTVHEFAHNYVGHLMGDPVPKATGRLTLDPRVHVNWTGFLMFVVVGFGILGRAPIDPKRMRDPRWGYLFSVAAGPLANLVLAVLSGIVFRLLSPLIVQYRLDAVFTGFLVFVYFNALLFVLNVLPFFPLDGWHIVRSILPAGLADRWASERWLKATQYIFLALIVLSFIGGRANVLGIVIGRPTNAITRVLLGY